jgi:hypothetical protein
VVERGREGLPPSVPPPCHRFGRMIEGRFSDRHSSWRGTAIAPLGSDPYLIQKLAARVERR